jgi:hypothetical protein
MRRKIHLSSLSVGRCFTLPTEAEGSAEERPDGVTRTGTILSSSHAWKVTDMGDQVSATSASGEGQSFGLETEVVEIPRQGYDKLASQ